MYNKVGNCYFIKKIFLVFGFVVFVIMSTVCSKALDENIDDNGWNSFKITHDKSYENAKEESFRKMVYMKNKLKIEKHNKLYENGQVSFTLRMNHLGDLTLDEYHKRLNGLKPSLDDRGTNHTFVKFKHGKYPKTVDWRTKGYVTEVKDQKNCGACWAFSATGALEGQHFAATGKLVSLSVQQLLDCSKRNRGCTGGTKESAFQYVIDNSGINTDDSYPYEATVRRCRYDPEDAAVRMSAYEIVPAGDANLLAAVAGVGPVAVSINASLHSFRHYGGGVYDDPGCGADGHNHAVLVVGYGSTDDGRAYWTAKNSWGADWGVDGYVYLSRDRENLCGVSDHAAYPVV